jgi:hypothetical protein
VTVTVAVAHQYRWKQLARALDLGSTERSWYSNAWIRRRLMHVGHQLRLFIGFELPCVTNSPRLHEPLTYINEVGKYMLGQYWLVDRAGSALMPPSSSALEYS